MRKLALAALAVVAVSVAGCVTISSDAPPTRPASQAPSSASDARVAPDPALQPFYDQQLVWRDCGGGNLCAPLTVPLSYSDPGGATLKIALLKNPATGNTPRGPLVINPGGPGGSGVDYAESAASAVTPALHREFDIIGFDPRGVARSEPVDCLTDSQTDAFIGEDPNPDNAAELEEFVASSQGLATGCAADAPVLAAAVGTNNVARDLDVLRAALDVTTLDYLGFSYGTFIGAVYAELFPSRVGRFVLDGAMDPTLTNTQLSHDQALGFEVALQRYIADCVSKSNCPLGNSVPAANARLAEFLAEVEQNPLPTDSGRPLTSGYAYSAIVYPLYQPSYGWPVLTSNLRAALAGDGSGMMDLVDLYNERNADGTYASNGLDALYAVNCIDRPDRPGVAESKALADEWAVEAPFFGALLAYGNLPCHYWQYPATDTPSTITAPGTPPILVVGTEFDPATPYSWAVALASQLSNGVLLSWEGGDGHTAYNNASTCINETIDAFLIAGVVPQDETVCR